MSTIINQAHTNYGRADRGFTLVETLVALSLSVLIILGVTQVFIEGLSHVKGVRAEALLTSNAGYMVQMIRNELLRADSVVVNPSDASEVAMTQGADVTTFSLDGATLVRDDGIGAADITSEGVAVTNLTFTEVGESLRIAFTLHSGPRTNKTFTGQTTFAYRR